MLADLLRIILAFFLPPLAVATQVGVQASAFWLNLIFWLFSFGGLGSVSYTHLRAHET